MINGKKILWLLLMCTLSWSTPSTGSLSHYAVMTVQDQNLTEDLQRRFHAQGIPLFLVHHVKQGVSPGDMIRFADKAVLIDASVMQTLQTSGALKKLRHAPVLRLQASSKSQTWSGRSRMVKSQREQKAYRLGAEILQIFEDYFGKIPSHHEMVVKFNGQQMELLVPSEMMDALRFNAVRKVKPAGKPLLISLLPPKSFFVGDSLYWPLWGADPTDPESLLSYGVDGLLPPGLQYLKQKHAVVGRFDSAGHWEFKAWVRNSSGRTDSLTVELKSRKNQPPQLYQTRIPEVTPATNWSWTLPVMDPDHPQDQISCRLLNEHPYFSFVPQQCILQGYVPEDWQEDSVQVVLQDPVGAADTLNLTLSAMTLRPSALEAIRHVLPIDTLHQGKERFWDLSQLLLPSIRLERVWGMDSVSLFKRVENQVRLRLRPMKTGKDTLFFLLTMGQDSVVVSQVLQVKENTPPYFRSRLSSYRVIEGTPLSYTPVAIDDDEDPLKMTAIDPDGSEVAWHHDQVSLWTRSPGSYSMLFVVSDGVNPAVPHRIAWEVEPARKSWQGMVLDYHQVGSQNYWRSFYQIGAGRIGLFTPQLGKVFNNDPLYRHEWPFFWAGGSLLGEKGLARDNWLYLDFGLQLRNPSDRLVTGGFLLGIDCRMTSQNRSFPWIFEFEMHAHVNQAILVVDTSDWRNMDFILSLDQNGPWEGGEDDLDTEKLLNEVFGPSAQKIMDDASDPENVVLASRLEFLVPFWNDPRWGTFLGGGTVFREDFLIGLSLNQWVGPSLRHQWTWQWVQFEQGLRMGFWYSEDSGYKMRYYARLSLGLWR